MPIKKGIHGPFLAVQWLRLHTSTARGVGSIPGQGSKIPQATQCSQKENRAEFIVCDRSDGLKSQKCVLSVPVHKVYQRLG